MNNRVTIVLLVLFFGGLGAYWWAEHARSPTLAESQRLSGRVLPQLIDTDARGIARVEIDGGPQALKFARRDDGHWQMVSPVDVPAASAQVEVLITNLKALKRIGDAVTLTGPAESYGLDKPSRVVRLFEKGQDRPRAVLEVGKIAQDRRYVRAAGQTGAEVVDAAALGAVELGRDDWRDRTMFQVAPFDVEALKVTGSEVLFEARREGGRWRLVQPIQAPADTLKIDGLIADLVNLQVPSRDPQAFVADGLTDFRPYGLDPAELTIEVTPSAEKGPPQVVRLGRGPEDQPGRVFARRGDQREVVLVGDRLVRSLLSDPRTLRSPRVADIDAARVGRLQLKVDGTDHELERRGEAWEVRSPSPGPADKRVVETLIAKVVELQAMEFLDPARSADAGLDKPWATLRIWERPASGTETQVLNMDLGRVDQASKAVFARVEGEPRVAALPEAFVSALPRGVMAFRERAIITLGQGRIDKVERILGGKRVVVEASGPPPDFTRWRMTTPIEAPVDPENTARLVVLLGGMRAQDLIDADAKDLGQYGLDAPYLSVSWSSRPVPTRPGIEPGGPASGRLLIGSTVPTRDTSRYAKLDGQPLVFTLEARALAALEAEVHSRVVLGFKPDLANRVELIAEGTTSSWKRPPSPPGLPSKWVAEGPAGAPGANAADLIGGLVTFLGNVLTPRFEQYNGPIAPAAGLDQPRLTVRVHLDGESAPRELRVGAAGPEVGTRLATTATGPIGPVFLLPELPFTPWMAPAPLPEDPFQPDAP